MSELRDLHDALAWLERHWTGRIPPTRLHGRGVEPESALGSPELADAFRRYLEQRPGDVVAQKITEDCHHPTLPRDRDGTILDRITGCPDCSGMGVKDAVRLRYRDPMWKAFVTLCGAKQPARGQVGYGQMIFTLVLCDYRPEVAARMLGGMVVAGDVTWTRRDFWEPMFMTAIRALYSRYSSAPLPSRRSWVDLSESQQRAEEAA